MSITINTRGNMQGLAGLLDSELIGEPGRERLFIEQNTGAERCNERLKQLKQQQLRLAPAGKSEVSDDEDEDSDEDEQNFELKFAQQSEGSVVSAKSFKKVSSSESQEDESRSSSKSKAESYRDKKPQQQQQQPRYSSPKAYQSNQSPKESSELSARLQNNNNPVAVQYIRTDLIDDITELKQQLQDEGVNIEGLADMLNSITQCDIETLKLIKGILIRKTRKMQSNSIVEDLLFMVLKGVEGVLDGKTEVLGVKPNLKGLTKSVSIKMRNQRQYFSQILDENLAKWGVGQNSKLVAQILISSVKRAVINKDTEQTEDYAQSLKDLQQMYHKK